MPELTQEDLDAMYGEGASDYGFANPPTSFPAVGTDVSAPPAVQQPVVAPPAWYENDDRQAIAARNAALAQARAAIGSSSGFDPNATVGYSYFGPAGVKFPSGPPDISVPADQPTQLPNGVWVSRESYGHRQRTDELDRQAKAAAQAAQQAAQDAQMFQQMSRVATSLKDISEARRQIDIMGLQRDIQNGIPIHEAVTRHPMGLGAGYGNALRATATIAPPTFGKTPSGAEYVLDPRGTPHFTPGTGQGAAHALGQVLPVKGPNGEDLGFVVATGPNTGHYQKPEGVNLTPAQQVQVQRARISAINAELANAYSIPDKKIRDKFVADKTSELSDISSRLKDMPNKVEAPKSVAVLGQGTREDPARPMTREQFDSIPSKAYFINPSDGKVRQKK